MFRNVFLAVSCSLLLASCAAIIDNRMPHPGLKSATGVGYVEMWVPTAFGMWLKDLEQGPSTCDNIEISSPSLAPGKNLCVVKVLSWPAMAGHVGLGSMKYRPLADNFSACRFPMPAGKHTVYVQPGLNCYPKELLDKFRTGGYAVPGALVTKYNTPVFVADFDVQPGRMHNYLLHVALDGDKVKFYMDEANTSLPIPKVPQLADPDPASYSPLVKMLDAKIWGFRWYAAKRLGFLENKAAIPVLKKKLAKEKHKDVRNEIEKALERLK